MPAQARPPTRPRVSPLRKSRLVLWSLVPCTHSCQLLFVSAIFQFPAAAPKPTKRYKSSRGRKATKSTETRNDSPSPDRDEEEEQVSDDNDASDGDEYVGERGGDVSDPEDTTMMDDAQPGPSARSERIKQSSASSLSAPNKGSVEDTSSRRVSETMRRPSASSKAASTSKKSSARKPTGPTDASTEEARSKARKVLATALEKIFASAAATQRFQSRRQTNHWPKRSPRCWRRSSLR